MLHFIVKLSLVKVTHKKTNIEIINKANKAISVQKNMTYQNKKGPQGSEWRGTFIFNWRTKGNKNVYWKL